MEPISIQDIEAHRGAAKPATIAKALGISAQFYKSLLARADISEAPIIIENQAAARTVLAQLNPNAVDDIVVAKPASGLRTRKTVKQKATKPAVEPAPTPEPAAVPAAAPDVEETAGDNEGANRADDGVDEELAAREEQNSAKRGGKDNPHIGKSADDLLKSLEQLAEPLLTDKGKSRARTVLEKRQAAAEARLITFAAMGVPGGVSATLEAIFLSSIDAALGCGKKQAKLVWNEVRADYARANQKTPEEIVAEQRAREEEAAKAAAIKLATDIEQLEKRVGHIAKDPKLMENILDVLDIRGVVGERAGKVASYLTGTSRLTATTRALCLLRRGPAASGKNHLIEKVLDLFPPEDLVKATGMSPKALAYYGGVDNPDAFKHKILYLAEAAAIAERGGQEHEVTIMLRCIISEGYLQHMPVDGDGDERATRTITKWGPIAVMLTSARSNVEAELLTRLILDDTDETIAQTRRIHARIAADAEGQTKKKPKYSVEELRDFQRLLALNGPYRVVVPFANAALAANGSGPAPLRARRDLGNVLEGVKASAIMHSAQRERDADGAIIATLDDYAWAFIALSPGLASFYRPQASAPVVRLIEALERIKAGAADVDKDGGFFAPYAQINKELGITSDETVNKRLKEATSAKLIERVEVDRHFSDRAHTRAGRYRILVPSRVLRAETVSHVLPTPEAVAEMLKHTPEHIAGIIAAMEAEEAKEQAQEVPKPVDGQEPPKAAADDPEAADRERARRAKAALYRLRLDHPDTTKPVVDAWLQQHGLKSLGMAGAPQADELAALASRAILQTPGAYDAEAVDVLKEFC